MMHGNKKKSMRMEGLSNPKSHYELKSISKTGLTDSAHNGGKYGKSKCDMGMSGSKGMKKGMMSKPAMKKGM